jgi:hypothetical protein
MQKYKHIKDSKLLLALLYWEDGLQKQAIELLKKHKSFRFLDNIAIASILQLSIQ